MIRAAALLLSLGLSACAWSNRANRPVWNAFEEHLVPEDDAAFVATLPLTVPGGVLAILTDTFVVHPAQVVDDAADDARELWEHMNWSERYYTELASLPVRTVGTPVVFVGSFLGRSCFDIDRRRSSEDVEAERRARAAEALRWLRSIAAGGSDWPPSAHDFRLFGPDPNDELTWNDELQAAFEAARRQGNGQGRLVLYRTARRERWPPWRSDPEMGLQDPDPVVRYELVRDWGRLSEDAAQQLCHDPNEMVRLAARRSCR